MTCSNASAAGCVWRHEAWYLNEVSIVAQRVPRASVSRAGLASVDMPAAIPCGPSNICAAPVKPSFARYAAIKPAAAACAVCNCLLSAPVRKNSHKPADCVPADPKACCICAASSPSRLPTAAAAAVGNLLGLDAAQMQHAFGSAGTQSAGLWEFLRTAADSKQLHTAHAAAAGLMAAYLAKDGFTGAAQILEGPQGMAAGMSTDANPARLTDALGTRWATIETSFKYHASCRHTHPAADALL